MRLTKYLSDGSAVVCCNRAFVDVSYVGEPDGVYFGSIIDKLAAYEDAEEQGRLVILPCKVGDTVYVEWSGGREYSKSVVEKISIGADGQVRFLIPAYLHSHSASLYQTSDFGKTVFLTRAEAENALRKGGVET